MTDIQRDVWAEWLLSRRFGGNADRMAAVLDFLVPVRDRVLAHADLQENQTLLDVGCGDGLIGFGALNRSQTTRVVFSDVSQDLLDQAQAIAVEMGVSHRCRFVRASAEDLSMIEDESVEAVTTRSVLIYVAKKQPAFDEFHRVLKPGGRLSVFEPINRFRHPEPPNLLWGVEVTPVREIAGKIKTVYHRIQPPDRDAMTDFDERTLLEFAERAGFKEIHLDFHAEIKPRLPDLDWDAWLHVAGNPKIPTLEEAMQEALTPPERDAFIAYLKPLVDSRQGIVQSARAYLWAVK